MSGQASLSRVVTWAVVGSVAWLGCSDSRSVSREALQDPEPAADVATAPTVPTPSEALTNTVVTSDGPVMGFVEEANGKQVRTFRSLPYAASSAGENRFKPPQPVASWTEVRDATEFADRCPQAESRLVSIGELSEDCLTLNVITPAATTGDRLPVMVFFHGGGLTIGTGNSPTYTATGLPSVGNVVVVTVNSRLNVFGYLSHAALAAESPHGSSGNYGTLDLIASLEWVKENASAFGGDPGNVTIFGESGGGTKVLSVMASPLAAGLYHRAIVESGSGAQAKGVNTPRDEAEEAGAALVAELGIAEDADVLAELRKRSYEEIMAAASASSHRAGLAIDGWVLPKSIYDVFQAGEQGNVPLIVGANEGEVRLLSGSVPDLAAAMSSVSSDAWVYSFSHVPAGWRSQQGCVAFHGLELAYVFGHLEGVTSDTAVFLGRASCPTGTDPMLNEEDDAAALNTMRIWAQFARTGNPSVEGLIDWPPYTREGDQYLDLSSVVEVKTGVASAGVTPGG